MSSIELLIDALTASLGSVGDVPTDAAMYRPLSDEQFSAVCGMSAQLQRMAATVGAVVAGEVAHRSRRELGSTGLAQRSGFRSPEEMVRIVTGVTGRDAVTAVRIGRLAHDAARIADPATGEIPVPDRGWLTVVGRAVSDGRIGVAAAESITNGLGGTTPNVTDADLTDAAAELCRIAAEPDPVGMGPVGIGPVGIDPDRLYRLARQVRDEIDEAGIADREASRRAARSLTIHSRPDGMTRLVWVMDPETAATVTSLHHRATSPRRVGPRMVDLNDTTDLHDAGGGDSQADLGQFVDDRKPAQVASDTFVQLLMQGADADTSRLLGSGAPSVRVLVTEESLRARQGHGFLEGQTDPVSIGTVERLACAGSTMSVVFGADNQPLDLDREQRLYNGKQHTGLAIRDGGCTIFDCDQPPAACEAHHIEHWYRDGGKTNIADGILLCRHHHLLLHNNGWEITRSGSDYFLIPPKNVDPNQVPRPMPSKSPAYRQLMKQKTG